MEEQNETFQHYMSNTDTEEVGLYEEIIPAKSWRMDDHLEKHMPSISQGVISMKTSHKERSLWKLIKVKENETDHIVDEVRQMRQLPSFVKSLFINIMHNQERRPQNKLWTKSNKCIALAIYIHSLQAYMYLEELLPMPSVNTLKRLKNFIMGPGIYPEVLDCLENGGSNVGHTNKICVLLFGEMALEKHLVYDNNSGSIDGFVDLGNEGGKLQQMSDRVLVFMLQGLNINVKQPVAHYFVNEKVCNEKLGSIIQKLILSLRNIGYTVIATVCNQDTNNIAAFDSLKKLNGINPESNYFKVDTENVYIIFDVPHLLKSIRNVFRVSGELRVDNNVGKWKYLVEINQKNKGSILFKKLSELHINPTNRLKNRVQLAADILSNHVAALVMLFSQIETDREISREMSNTAEVLRFMDRLFACTNGPSSHNDVKKNYRENVSENSFHHRYWMECLQKLRNTYFLNCRNQKRLKKIKCINGYITTISSIQEIWKYLEQKNITYLNLRQLNLDALDNFFVLIRQLVPKNTNLTCHRFQSAIKTSILMRLRYYKNKFTNCEKDDNILLFDFRNVVFNKP